MQGHNVFAYAADHETFAAAALAASASQCPTFPAPSGMVIGMAVCCDRRALRNDSRVMILPSPHSPTDITKAASDLGITNAKTARDIYAAVFELTNADMFDPDL